MSRDVNGYLSEQQKKSSGDLATEWGQIEDLYNKKLWHQLTLKLSGFVKHPTFSSGDGLQKLYHNFLADFEHKINPLALAEIVVHIVAQLKDAKEAIEFLDKIREKVKGSDEACCLCLTAAGVIQLRQKDMAAVNEIISKVKAIFDTIDGITTVHGRFYELASNYHKLIGNHAEYYADALRYLGCTDIADIPETDQLERAFNLGLAAILGKGVYNFGELLAHPVLNAMRGTDKQWLVDLLYAFNSGNITKFNELKPQWHNQPDLATHEIDMRQKISLLCLMEMTFKRPATNRLLSFEEISKEAHLPITEVELLVMRALSLGLVRGSIDQVDAKVHMTWVQPRVLDKDQISTMQSRLSQWCKDVQSMQNLVQDNAQDILT